MNLPDIARQRLYNQRLIHSSFTKPEEVVEWQGAVQAQEYAHAKWALGLRMTDAFDAEIEQAFTEGKILRTHVMRPTWHFVTPADIRWLLALTAPRIHALNAYMVRQLELDEALLQRSNAAIAKALQGGKQLTRAELGEVLAQIGIDADGMRLGYIVHRAELDAVICSGRRRGKQFTYALLDERAPQARTLEHDEALAELIRRYFISHGPATLSDFTWWSSLTIADAKAGVEMAKAHLEEEVVEGKSYWRSTSTPAVEANLPTVYMLPIYDEYFSHRDRSASVTVDAQKVWERDNSVFNSIIVIDGQAVGTWRRTLKKAAVILETRLFRSLTDAESEGFALAVQRYSEFHGLPVVMA